MAAIIPTTLERWFTPQTRARRPDIVDRVAKSMRAGDPAIYAAMWNMMAGLDFADRLGEIGCPTLVMTGEADPICPPAVAKRIYDGVAGSQLAIVPDAAHMCILEQPDAISERIASFYARSIPKGDFVVLKGTFETYRQRRGLERRRLHVCYESSSKAAFSPPSQGPLLAPLGRERATTLLTRSRPRKST